MAEYAINKQIMHPQWGAPMGYHVIARVEVACLSNLTYITLSSYYSKQVYEAGSSPMSNTNIKIDKALLVSEQDLLNEVVLTEDEPLFDGTVEEIYPVD